MQTEALTPVPSWRPALPGQVCCCEHPSAAQEQDLHRQITGKS